MISWKLRKHSYLSKRLMLEEGDGRMFVVNVVSKSRGVNDSEGDSNTILLKLWKVYSDKSGRRPCTAVQEPLTDVSGLYLDTRFNMSLFWAFDDLVLKDVGLTQRIHKGCASRPRGTFRDGWIKIILSP